jgi:CHAT domain-containing protein
MSALLLVLALALPDSAADHAADVVRRYWTARAAGDARAATACWSPSAAATARVEQRIAMSARARCTQLLRLTAEDVDGHGDSARVRARADLVSWSMFAGDRERFDTIDATFELERSGGGWRIVAERPDVDAQVDAIATAPEPREAVTEMHTPAVAIGLSRRAITLINQGQLPRAAAVIAAARAITETWSDDSARSAAEGAQGVLLRVGQSPDFPASIAAARESLALAERAGDPDAMARALLRLGRASASGDLALDRLPFERALTLEPFVEDGSVIAHCATQLAQISSDLSDRRAELRYALLAMRKAQESGDATSLMSAHMNMAGAYESLGEDELGASYIRHAFEIGRKAGFPIAWLIFAGHGDPRTRKIDDELLREVEQRLKALGDDAGPIVALELHQILAWGLIQRDPGAAEAELDRADEYVRVANDWREAAWSAYVRGALRLAQGRYAEAIELLRDNRVRPHSLQLARAYLGQHDDAAAEATLRAAIEAAEDHRLASPPNEARAQLVGHAAEAYTALVHLLLEQHRTREALAMGERLKARALRDLLEGDRVLLRASLTPAERQKSDKIDERLNHLNRRLAVSCSDRGTRPCRELVQERDAVRAEWNELFTRLHADHAAAAAPHDDGVRIDVPGALGNGAILEYVVDDDSTIVFSAVRGPDGTSIEAAKIPLGRAALEARTGAYLRRIEMRDVEWTADAAALYRLLVAPLKNQLARATSLIIVPDGPLWRLPFGTLTDRRGRPLIERFAISYAPSIDSLHRMLAVRSTARNSGPALLALGDPALGDRAVRPLHGGRFAPLADAAREARAVGALYAPSSHVLTGRAATEAALVAEAPEYRVLHLATHALIDEKTPLYSAIALTAAAEENGDDGLLEAREIADLSLRAELVVLSACDTARGRVTTGEGVIGLSWAFLAAGTPTLVVSQWKAASRPTAELMIEFHRLLQHGYSKAEALRRAALNVRSDPRYADPLYWSPFIVLGAP